MKIALTVLFFWSHFTVYAQSIQVTVKANGFIRENGIVTAILKKPLPKQTAYQLVNVLTKKTIPTQQLDSNRIIFILTQKLQANETATFRLVAQKKPSKPSGISVSKQANGLLIKCNNKNVLFYNTSVIAPSDSLPNYYARSGFIHPLYTPSGSIVTDDFPVGHAHQHGIMMAWASTLFKNKPHDFWNQQQQTGNVKHVNVISIDSGAVATIIKLRLQQYSLTFGGVLDEVWTITVYPFSNYFLFDLVSQQQNITNDTLYLNKYHYGSIAFRGSKQWNDADSLHFTTKWNILTNDGHTLANADGKRASYVAASGLIDGNTAGVTVFGFPQNYNYPQPIRVHPTMPYWGFAPSLSNGFNIPPNSWYTSAFRYFVHDGNVDVATLQQLNNNIIHPVEVKVLYQ